MKTIIVASGALAISEAIRARISQADLIIAADGGAVHLHQMGLTPKVIIGDMDSITKSARDHFERDNVPFLPHPPRKDQTDMELCLDWALEQGASDITLLGATGLRLDHTLANIMLLKRIKDAGISGRVMDEHNEICLVTDFLELEGTAGGILSLVPVSDQVTGITLEGFEYPLEDATLTLGSARGISNRFAETRGIVRIGSGMALVIKSRE